jgi:hypothetical protein
LTDDGGHFSSCIQNLWPLAAFWPILFAFHSASVALGFE